MELAPVTLFIYNRPHYLRRTLGTLKANLLSKDTPLIVFADGPRENSTAEDVSRIMEARRLVKSIDWCRSVKLIERESNFGLANSIISGVREVLEEHRSTIVLEDDLELSPYFLKYMNDSLRTYKDEKDVLSIGACNFFATDKWVPETFFIPIPDCLGWATWSDRWRLFEPNGAVLLDKLKEKNLIDAFNVFGGYDFEGLLNAQIQGKTSSWAIRWQAVSYIEGKVNLYPKYALTNHIGVDSSATNSSGVDYSKRIVFPKKPLEVQRQNVRVKEEIMKTMVEYYKSHKQQAGQLGLIGKCKRVISRIVKYF